MINWCKGWTAGHNLLKLLNWCGTALVIKTLDVTNLDEKFVYWSKNLCRKIEIWKLKWNKVFGHSVIYCNNNDKDTKYIRKKRYNWKNCRNFRLFGFWSDLSLAIVTTCQ